MQIIEPNRFKRRLKNYKHQLSRWWSADFYRKIEMIAAGAADYDYSAPMTEKTIHRWGDFGASKYGRRYRVVTFVDDGNEIGIGYSDSWDCIMRRSEWDAVVFRYVMLWIFKDWFGLRSKLYWWAFLTGYRKRKNAKQ